MSAETLRRAAAQIRNDHGGVVSRNTRDGRRWLPVADWLDHAAISADVVESAGLTFGGFDGRPALAVATAYLGETTDV